MWSLSPGVHSLAECSGRTAHWDHSTEQGYPTPFSGLTQGKLSGGGTTRTTGDKRAGWSQVRGYEEHSPPKLFKTTEEATANVTWALSLLPAGLGAEGEGGPRAFPSSSLSNSLLPGATQPRVAFPALCLRFLKSHFSSPLGHILSLWGMLLGAWGHFLPAPCPPPPSVSFWVPGRALGVLRVPMICQRELAGTQPLRAAAGPAVTAGQVPGITVFLVEAVASSRWRW